MNTKFSSMRMDVIGIAVLSAFLFIGLFFRASPISIMNPGFPILSESDWKPMPLVALDFNKNPQRFISENNFGAVGYSSLFRISGYSRMLPNPSYSAQMEPVEFLIYHIVVRYDEAGYSIPKLQDDYKKHIDELTRQDYLITEIPGLDFVSRADAYYIWCEQIPGDSEGVFHPERVESCYYWAVYGRYYSLLRFSQGIEIVSVDLFNDILKRTDEKLANARR